MESTCRRCHQSLPEECGYCPVCGLPQMVYDAEYAQTAVEQTDGASPIRDADSIAWSRALKACLILAVPAGLLSSAISPIGGLGFLLAAAAAAWSVALYHRMEHPAWITLGAGLRIGLATGLIAAWLAFAVSGGALFFQRYALRRGPVIDQEWATRVEASQQMTQQWMSGSDSAQGQEVRNQVRAFMLSPEGHAGIELFGFAANAFFLVCFASGGGALGARWGARVRRSEF